MHPVKDLVVTKELCFKAGCGRVISGLTASELCGLLGNAEFAVGMRLHMLIFAARMGVPMIGIAYDPKIGAFLDYIGESCLDVRTLCAGQVAEAAKRAISDRDAISERLSEHTAKLRALALSDCEKVCELINDNNI